MGKLEELQRLAGANSRESMGEGRPGGAAPGPPQAPASSGMPARLQGISKSKNAVEIPVDKVHPDPDQPREDFDPESLARLAESLKARGQLQPIRVRWDEVRGAYIIICGERRWRAAAMAGMATMSAVVVEGEIPPGELLAIQLVENCLREDLKPVEQSKAYRALMDRNGWSIRQLAAELALDHTAVSRALKLLEMPESVQVQVERGDLSPWTAYEIAKVEDPAEQTELAARVVSEGLSRAETVEVVRQTTGKGNKPARGKGKGGAGKPRKVTSRVFRTTTGPRITVEFRKGLDDGLVLAALAEAMHQINVARTTEDQSAA
jgi:ParB family transcriptional regulator, chromosome partitioning protein